MKKNVNYNEAVTNYINTRLNNDPIFLEEVRAYIFNVLEVNNIEVEEQKIIENINVILNRLNKTGVLKTFVKGIYYKPEKNIFGVMPLDRTKVIKKKYLEDEHGNTIGYITGAKLFNRLGLTTQVPNTTTIVTNNCNNKYDYKIDYLNIIVKKAPIKITQENYLYLQLIEVLINKENINIEVENYYEIIYNYIEENNLEFEKIIKYARETNSKKVLEQLFKLAR